MKKLTVCLLALIMLIGIFTFGVNADTTTADSGTTTPDVTTTTPEAQDPDTDGADTEHKTLVHFDNGVYTKDKNDKVENVTDSKKSGVSEMPEDVTEETIKIGEDFTFGKIPEREKFVFLGWYSSTGEFYRYDAETEKFYLDYNEDTKEYSNEVAGFTLEEEITLTAVWGKANGGIFSMIWGFLVMLFGKVMWFCAYITGGNYLFAIFLFAVVFKIVLFPFSIKQQKNSVKMAKLAPKQAAIQKKYKGRDDQASRQRMQQEIMEMQQKEGYNPMGGCGPLVVQMVLVFALYEVIRNPLRYICGLDSTSIISALHMPMATDELSLVSKLTADSGIMSAAKNVVGDFSMPAFKAFGIDLSIIPSDKVLWYILIPILTYVGMVLSMKLTRKLSPQPAQTQDVGCSMKVMDYGMPLMSAYIAFIWPSILGVYWIFQNVLGVAQQLVLKKMYPVPVFTEEDYKEEERRLRAKSRGRDRDVYKTAPDGKQYRSLHHIDDEPEETAVDNTQDNNTNKPAEGAPKLKDDKK